MKFWYGFSKGQRGCNNFKIVYISNFSQFWSRGGGHQKSMFSQIQNTPNYPRGGGQRKWWTFSTICDIFFCLEGSPNKRKFNFILTDISFLHYFVLSLNIRCPISISTNIIWHYLSLSDTFWCYLRPFYTIWEYLTLSGNIRHYLIDFDTIWPYLTLSYTICHYLRLSYSIWHYLVLSGTIWHYLTQSDAIF